jgi:hypothetical protein
LILSGRINDPANGSHDLIDGIATAVVVPPPKKQKKRLR